MAGSTATSEQLITGWGLTMPSRATIRRPCGLDDIVAAIRGVGPRGMLVRGAGRSYGDAAQNGGGEVLDLAVFSEIEILDGDDGDVVAGAGALFSDIIPLLLARGRFLPVTPGTRYVTVGGAIAADVHGKNHHVDGSFGAHLRWIDLVTADGSVRHLCADGPEGDRRLLSATVGGMGLTGVILRARFATIPAPNSSVVVDTRRAADLDSLMAMMDEGDARHRYSVAWIDGMAKGRHLGRGVLTHADHAPTGAAASLPGENPFAAKRIQVPPIPVSPLSRATVRMFNEAYFRRAPLSRMGELTDLASFFYPLDALDGWNRLYGRRGFLQYQFAVPDSGSDVVRLSLEKLAGIGAPSFLSVLKRFGPGRAESPLSFPLQGWTLAVDVPTRTPGLAAVLDALDEHVLEAGGRHYLAKDSRAVPATIVAGYPRLAEFREIKRDVDPYGIFVSDLSRRLNL